MVGANYHGLFLVSGVGVLMDVEIDGNIRDTWVLDWFEPP
jgi:hypothetical protein